MHRAKPILLTLAAVGLGALVSQPRSAASQTAPRYRCSFSFEPDASRALDVVTSCSRCTERNGLERCAPARLSGADTWLAEVRAATETRMTRRPAPIVQAGASDEWRIRYVGAMAAGTYVLHFVPGPGDSHFREPFTIDASHRASPTR